MFGACKVTGILKGKGMWYVLCAVVALVCGFMAGVLFASLKREPVAQSLCWPNVASVAFSPDSKCVFAATRFMTAKSRRGAFPKAGRSGRLNTYIRNPDCPAA